MTKHTTKQINDALSIAYSELPPGSTWLHYKGGIYSILGFTVSTDTGDLLVRYRRIDGTDYDYENEFDIEYSRPIYEWLDEIPTPYGCDADGNMIIPPGHITRFERVRKVEMWKLLNSVDRSVVIR
jgi:hypothetical protein